jgi:large subunit ribosomal protein L23
VNAKTVSEAKQAPEKKEAEKKAAVKKKPASAAAASPRRFAADRLMNVVLAPVVSEKSTFVADKNRQYVFRVADDATKPQIKAAVELMFKTKVEGVTVLNVKGKERRFGRTIGRKRSWKKAYVRLAEGQEINFAATQ